MPVKSVVGGRTVVCITLLAALMLLATGALDAAFAQAGPFGGSRPPSKHAPQQISTHG